MRRGSKKAGGIEAASDRFGTATDQKARKGPGRCIALAVPLAFHILGTSCASGPLVRSNVRLQPPAKPVGCEPLLERNSPFALAIFEPLT